MIWSKHTFGPDSKFATHAHASGWQIHHCGHPTANWPYYLTAPGGSEMIMSHNGRGFCTVAICKAVVAHLLIGTFTTTTENCEPGIATVRNVTAFGEQLPG